MTPLQDDPMRPEALDAAGVNLGIGSADGDGFDDANRLALAGWKVVWLRADDLTGALEELGLLLDFPSYYGKNLDALWDCLRDVERPTAVVWRNWQNCALGDPHGWGQILPLLLERTSRSPQFTVLLPESWTHEA